MSEREILGPSGVVDFVYHAPCSECCPSDLEWWNLQPGEMEQHPLTPMDAIDPLGWIAPMNSPYGQDMSPCAPVLEVHERHNGKPSDVDVFHLAFFAGETRQKSCLYPYLFPVGLFLSGTGTGPRRKQGQRLFVTASQPWSTVVQYTGPHTIAEFDRR